MCYDGCMVNHQNRAGYRYCNRCEIEFALTSEFFPKDKNRACGYGYQCKECANEIRRLRGDNRKNRWLKSMTPEQRARKYEIGRRYQRGAGRNIVRIASYRNIDKKRGLTCDLDTRWFEEHIASKPCFYCEDANSTIGCDRILNSMGHTKGNVVPCCYDCNTARMNRFTHEEMMILGKAIKRIKEMRSSAHP